MPVNTRYGSLDETAFEAFQDDFDPDRILRAIDELDRVKHGISAMQEELLELHRMAESLMEIDSAQPNASASIPDHESIWMLAEDISSRAWEWPDIIEVATDIADEVAKLAPDPDAEWEDEE